MPNGCCEWTGSRQKESGYGRFTLYHGKTVYAHRLIFEHYSGIVLARNDYVCHKCDNPPCVKYKHLFIGSPLDNIDDSIEKGRWMGSKLLTKEEVLEIIDAYPGLSQQALADRYHVSQVTISHIINGKTWGNVDAFNRISRAIL